MTASSPCREWIASISIRHLPLQETSILTNDMLLHPAGIPEVQGFLLPSAAGTPVFSSPASVLFPALPDSALLIRVQNGSFFIESGKSSVSISSGEAVFLPLLEAQKLDTRIIPGSLSIYLVQSSILSSYFDVVPSFSAIPADSVSSHSFDLLDGLLEAPSQAGLPFRLHRILTDLLTDWIPKTLLPVPEGWLSRLHMRIHQQYQEPFSLEEAEQTLQISRFRICRVYRETYGKPPLQDLNGVRIAEASRLLKATDLSVQEISTRVGFENCSHFITLFRRQTGMTPGAFRKR